jgi:hypothetical protein
MAGLAPDDTRPFVLIGVIVAALLLVAWYAWVG